jgi:hypothetical protein
MQRLVVPTEVIARLPTYRHACRLAWKMRNPRNLTMRTVAEHTGCYVSHVSDYFSVHATRRELPAKYVGSVNRMLGNTIISQWLAHDGEITVVEELRATRLAMRANA